MSAAAEAKLVDRGLVLCRQLEAAGEELERIEEELAKLALDNPHRQEELLDKNRDGRRFLAQGSERTVPIILTADKIVGEFAEHGARHKALAAIAANRLRHFFVPSNKWENLYTSGKEFRAAAVEILGQAAGDKFIQAALSRDRNGVPKSDIRIHWQDAEENEL